jgi:hypothetical protein
MDAKNISVILLVKVLRKVPLRKPSCKLVDNIKMDFGQRELSGMKMTDL